MRLPTFFAAKGWMLAKLACLRILYIYGPDLRAMQKLTQLLDMIEKNLLPSKKVAIFLKLKTP
jgi:hypothetical protein